SLLLGLYNDEGALQHVGIVGAFTAKRRAELVDELAPLRLHDGDEHPWSRWAEAEAHAGQRLPGSVSRWNAQKDLSFVPLGPERAGASPFPSRPRPGRSSRPPAARSSPARRSAASSAARPGGSPSSSRASSRSSSRLSGCGASPPPSSAGCWTRRSCAPARP